VVLWFSKRLVLKLLLLLFGRDPPCLVALYLLQNGSGYNFEIFRECQEDLDEPAA